MEKDFEQWIYETDTVSVRSSKSLGVSAGPEVSEDAFLDACKKAAEEKKREAMEKLGDQYKTRIKALQDRIDRQNIKVEKYENQLTSRRADTALKVGESLFKLVSKGKITGVSTSSTKMRMSSEAKARLEEAETVLENYQEDLINLHDEFDDKKTDLNEKWEDAVNDIQEVKISPTKQNIRISRFGILWLP